MLDTAQIRELLPHRPPMLLVDGVTEIDDVSVVAYKQLTDDDPWLRGHFPGLPLMPGVLVLEAMAQAGALLAHHCGSLDNEREVLLLISADKVKFRKPVRPGDRLELEVAALRKGKVWKMRGAARVAGERVAEAELVASIKPRAAL